MDIIEPIYKDTLMQKLGVRRVPMSQQKMPIGRQNVNPTAYYKAEGDPFTATGQEFDQVSLDLKKLTALAPISNEFLRRDARVGMDYVGRDLHKAAVVAMDTAFLRGAGGDEPTSLESMIHADNKLDITVTSGNATLSDFEGGLDDAQLAVMQALSNPDVGEFAMPYGPYLKLRRVRDNGETVYPGLSESNRTFRGHKVHLSNNILEEQDYSTDGDGDEYKILFGDFSEVIMGVGTGMRLDVSEHSQFRNDITDVRLIMEHDWALRRAKAIAQLISDYLG